MKRAMSVAVVHSPAAASSGSTIQPPGSGVPWSRWPCAALPVSSAGSGWAKVEEVMPAGPRTSARAASANFWPVTSSITACTIS